MFREGAAIHSLAVPSDGQRDAHLSYQGVAERMASFTASMFFTPSRPATLQRLDALLGVDRNAVLPGGAPAQHAGVIRARLGGHAQRLGELRVAHARAEIDERLGGHRRGLAEMAQGLLAGVGLLTLEIRWSLPRTRR